MCVDLDGTLVFTDTLLESLTVLLRNKPLYLLLAPFWLLRGRSFLKQQLAIHAPLDVASLPYNGPLVAKIREYRAAGSRTVLLTAADSAIASRIASHVGCFNDVIASDGRKNLKGRHKVTALRERLGTAPFVYIGNSKCDVAVWQEAASAIAAGNCRTAVHHLEQLGLRSSLIGEVRHWHWRDVLRALRVHQWLKNVLIFVPLITSHEYTDPLSVLAALLACVAFSLCASGVYLFNDVLDLDSDRKHAVKCKRPFADGRLELGVALTGAPLLMAAALLVAALLPPAFFLTVLSYIGLTSLYSLRAKTVPILDVLVLAGLYALRIWAGGAAISVAISPWLLAFSIFVFVSLALVKRYCEVSTSTGINCRRGYLPEDAILLMMLGVASGYSAALVLGLYIQSPVVHTLYAAPGYLWWLSVIYLYWISRVWLLARRGLVDDDPIVFAAKDRTTWMLAAISVVPFVLAITQPF